MADVLFLAVVVAFFALAGLYVTACERLVGRERLDDARDAVGADAGPRNR